MSMQEFDVVVVGGGPSGATAAEHLARQRHSVLLLDRAGRPKPCGGAIPPRLIRDFAIPDQLICARIKGARIVAPSSKTVDMPIDEGYVGMVDRDRFDEWLRERAALAGATRATGHYEALERDPDGCAVILYRTKDDVTHRVRARLVVAADGARSVIAKHHVKGGDKVACVFAYHEIIRTPAQDDRFNGSRCDVVYDGRLSPDFYTWVFPHGSQTSIGTGSARKGFSLRQAVTRFRQENGLEGAETIRREGAPIPMKPLKRWDNGRDIVLAGDAAGVVAPASGEGIYYAMLGGELAAKAGTRFLATGDAKALSLARKQFMKAHGRVFWILGVMQYFWYKNDWTRERFVKMCGDKDVQRLTWESYMNKELVRTQPVAKARIFFKDLAHLLGLARA